MGYAIREALKREPDRYDLVAGFDLKPDSSLPFPVYQTPSDFPGTADVLIDFSHPSALAGVLQFVCDRKIPAVIATTGLSETQREDLEAAANITPIFVSANMSLGINLLFDLVKNLFGL